MENTEKQEGAFTKQTIIDQVNAYSGDMESVILYMADQKIATLAARLSPITFMKFLEAIAKEDPKLLHAIKAMAFVLS